LPFAVQPLFKNQQLMQQHTLCTAVILAELSAAVQFSGFIANSAIFAAFCADYAFK
jgi:hypothetical protein